MKRSTLVSYFFVPLLLVLINFATALVREPVGLEVVVALLGGFLFYAAPYLLWAVIAAIGRFSNAAWHAGLLAASVALVAIAVLSLFVRDPSGLPLQWLSYWPLAVMLQFVSAGGTALYRRIHA